MPSIYEQWGFWGNPFQTTSLPADETGERLLVGRQKELQSLERKIVSGPKMATLEGLNGVGKTSVVNVASYRLFRAHVESGEGPLFIACRKIFQLTPGQDAQDFIDAVLMEVAQTLIERRSDVEELTGKSAKTDALNRWLNSTHLHSYQAGIPVLQAGRTSETNTSAGFERSGFRKLVENILSDVFPEEGGVVCMIDNLELLQKSDLARAQLEQLRDHLLTMKGLRWVLCGSLGIVYGVVSSPRLEGYVYKPIEIKDVGAENSAEILTSRIANYANNFESAYLPLRPVDFSRLYEVLHGNLRSALSYADDYCEWCFDRVPVPASDSEKEMAFNEWLDEQAESAHLAMRQALGPRAIEIFAKAVELGGVFSPSDYASFGSESIQALRPHIRDMEAAGVLVSTQDDGDKRRKTIQVTSKGWLVSLKLGSDTEA
ncbi:hypothetical protein [Burkholderia ubonensis]|uniref:hypothetical protein n=1 Tax=Burkholderia ubonensis TaxID=101571 RepID=UPI000A73C49B|nr:hypothetical protein [Burkholderia ubonensis]